ncbi:MAG: [FeFe] hydrogenase, group A [Deltaproteobacteria bacterium]|jgi:NADH-quinone oxidoreductase subunit G|nr:[FeFe] hydrogenase, group A [Deltaproteobacteria bacterium]
MRNITVTVDGISVTQDGEKNLLELIKKGGIELPTFCYHSEISVYGACRMCMVEVEGRGVLPACSTKPEDGMVVHTNTRQIRDMRRMIIELMLASHAQDCTVCPKSGECRLQDISKQLGVTKVRFKNVPREAPIDDSSVSILRDPSKCILCGDCVRTCTEVQSVGALDFAYRGAAAKVVTCFNKPMAEIECVNCGQCVKVCPVGALTPKYQIAQVWEAIYDPTKTVVVQIAPAVRVALGEYFGLKPGTLTIGKIVGALRIMGFNQVYDTCFGADFTVVEEGKEFLSRLSAGKDLPLFTSCCPAWVKFAEQYYPDLLNNLSTCRSPQQMFGSLCKEELATKLGKKREDLVVVSIMPCTAKKFEAARSQFLVDGNPDVDYVLTTKELSLMIFESGIDFDKLDLSSFDMPFGFSTGAAVIFGTSGGVSEAVLRFAAESIQKGAMREFKEFRGTEKGVKISEVAIGDKLLSLCVVSGLANARKIIDKIRAGDLYYDLVEVMACSGGCVNGGGQPITRDNKLAIAERSKGLYDNDRMLQFHVSSENPYLQKIYSEDLTPQSSHELLHTSYENRKRIVLDDFVISGTQDGVKLTVSICFGTSCFLRGSQELYKKLTAYVHSKELGDITEFKANFCGKLCKKGPVVSINDKTLENCTLEMATKEIQNVIGR